MRILKIIREVFFDSVRVSLDLFKIMIPIIIVVKILNELGWIRYLAWPLRPLMESVGLPPETGLIWAAAILNNLYTAVIVYVSLIPALPVLTVAQITVLGTMMLIAHSLPVEGRIAHKCGVSFWGQFWFRLLAAYLCGLIQHFILTSTGLLDQPSVLLWQGEAVEQDWGQWVLGEIINLGFMFLIILALMSLMRLLRYLKITDLIAWVLGPILKMLGIGKEAAAITVAGLTMGLAFGGGLIIYEAKSGRLTRKDILLSISLMGLVHGLIDDTILIALLGASLSGIFWGRLAFALMVIAILARWGFWNSLKVETIEK